MRVVVAVGGNALLERGEVPLAELQEEHVGVAVHALAPLAVDHDLVITHGNGPQVGMLANESALDPDLPGPYPLDVLGAESQGMIGYFFLQAFENTLPARQVVNLVCQTEVAADDPAFGHPTKFVGSIFTEDEGRRLAALRGWQIRPDGTAWRRVVPSPEPLAIVELPTIRALVESGAIVICAGGGGIPVVRDPTGRLRGAEAVVDKDLTAALLARDLGADALLILTDIANVETGFGTPEPHPIGRTTPRALRALPFPAGSMGPKVEAACRFVEATGRPAMIGRLEDAAGLLRGDRGTIIEPDPARPPAVHPRHPPQRGPDRVQTLAVPYHLADLIPDFDAGVDVDEEIIVDLPSSGAWQRMAVLYEAVARAVSSSPLPVTVVSGDCTTSLGVIAGLHRTGRDVGVVWIDAHGDFNTDATTPSGYLGGMPLALAVGVGTLTLPQELKLRPVPASRVVLVGARDIDREERLLLDKSAVRLTPLDLRAADLPEGDLHLHVDIDVCDPTAVPDLLFPAPGGAAPADVAAAVRRIMAAGRVVAVDLAATWHQNGPSAPTQRRVMREVADAVGG